MGKVEVNNRMVSKKQVKNHYRKEWQKQRFRELIKKHGVFTRNSFNGKNVIRRKNIKIRGWKDLEKHIDQHAVEIHTPTRNVSKSYVDVDIPRKRLKQKDSIGKKILGFLRSNNVKVKMVTSSPSGIHIFTDCSKPKLVKALKEIEKYDKKNYHVGKHSKDKIVLDPYEPNTSIPGSLSIKGSSYRELPVK